MRIVPFEEKYRDDLIFMVLEAKDAIGRVPTLNEDLLDIRKNYLDKGDMFWLALSDAGRVIGCIGYSSIPGTADVRLHRFYVKAAMKRQGIGSRLYLHAEKHLRESGKRGVLVHLGGAGYEASRLFYRHFGYEYEQDKNYMRKTLEK